jgi:redox-sensing transcriptional repressor
MKDLPEPAKRRLVLLQRLLSTYSEKTITSQKIQELGLWSAAVARRDISLLELNCGDARGYNVDELRKAIIQALTLNAEEKKCCIVGLGRLGQVLLDSKDLFNSSFKIVAGFDSSVNRTEVIRSTFPLHTTTSLEQVVREENISYAILSTSREEAQSMADKLCRSGIKGIVNFTPCVLSVPPAVKVENASLLTCLEMLSATAV